MIKHQIWIPTCSYTLSSSLILAALCRAGFRARDGLAIPGHEEIHVPFHYVRDFDESSLSSRPLTIRDDSYDVKHVHSIARVINIIN